MLDILIFFGHDNYETFFDLIDRFNSSALDIVEPLFKHTMQIRLSSDVPFHCAPRRLSYHEREEVEKITQDLLARGIIRPSNSPLIDDCIEYLDGKKCFSLLDFKSGF